MFTKEHVTNWKADPQGSLSIVKGTFDSRCICSAMSTFYNGLKESIILKKKRRLKSLFLTVLKTNMQAHFEPMTYDVLNMYYVIPVRKINFYKHHSKKMWQSDNEHIDIRGNNIYL